MNFIDDAISTVLICPLPAVEEERRIYLIRGRPTGAAGNFGAGFGPEEELCAKFSAQPHWPSWQAPA
jgi:hypothetical protein